MNRSNKWEALLEAYVNAQEENVRACLAISERFAASTLEHRLLPTSRELARWKEAWATLLAVNGEMHRFVSSVAQEDEQRQARDPAGGSLSEGSGGQEAAS